jgi:hypothetical protein
MVGPLSVRPVETKDDFNAFLHFPWTLYRDDPYWVPPLVSMQRDRLDQRDNPAWEYMDGQYFIARRGDRPVGTIAALINHRHNAHHGERIGFFGHFEVYDDQAAADALLDRAAGYVRAQGYEAVRGPATFSTNDLCGILVNDFEGVPPILTPYNYPYYDRLLANAPGYEPVMDLYNYRFTLQDFHASKTLEQALRITRRNNQRRVITVRTLDARRMRADLTMLKEIYNTAWTDNWGFVPYTEHELDEMVEDLGQFLDPRLTLFAFVQDQPAGFLLGFPDLNQVLHRAYPRPGRPELLTLLRALWHWKLRPKITRIRIALLGVSRDTRNIGVEAAMFAALFNVFRQIKAQGTHLHEADAGWVLETNDAMNRLVEALGGVRYRTLRFYERALRPD